MYIDREYKGPDRHLDFRLDNNSDIPYMESLKIK